MLDKSLIQNQDLLAANLKKRNSSLNLAKLATDNKQVSDLTSNIEQKKALKNKLSTKFLAVKNDPQQLAQLKQESSELSSQINALQQELQKKQAEFEQQFFLLPNIIADDVPVGDESCNQELYKKGSELKQQAISHDEYGLSRDWFDFERAAKIAKSRFSIVKGDGARLERALAQFMLDHQVLNNGYQEINVPLIVNQAAMFGTGQLPKFSAELFSLEPNFSKKDDQHNQFFLIPTAEVPLTVMFAGEILPAEQLPQKFCALTYCFRSEAGSYGKDVKGYLRQHQFFKVELVWLTKPEDSQAAHQQLLADAQSVLDLLELPYRVVVLASGDTGFSASKCYDIEVWLPSQQTYREISSCSNCTDFQARRSKIRFRSNQQKPQLVHSLNGSGLAVGRTLIAMLENHQSANGKIYIPPALRPYLGGIEYL